MKVSVAVDRSPEWQMALRYSCHLLEHFDVEVDAVYVKPNVTSIVIEEIDVPFIKKKDITETIEAETQQVMALGLKMCVNLLLSILSSPFPPEGAMSVFIMDYVMQKTGMATFPSSGQLSGSVITNSTLFSSS